MRESFLRGGVASEGPSEGARTAQQELAVIRGSESDGGGQMHGKGGIKERSKIEPEGEGIYAKKKSGETPNPSSDPDNYFKSCK